MDSGETRGGREYRTALDVVSLLSGKWEPRVVLQLRTDGPLGFNELLDAIPDVSGKVLSEALESLEAAGILERHVVSDAPLRVRYERTQAGRDLDSMFEAASEWGERHLEPTRPTVLVAGADRRQTEMFSQWVGTQYTAERANDVSELDSKLDDSVDVALVSDDLPGASRTALFERVRSHSRTICVVQDRPAPELLDLPCDDVLRTPVVRTTLLDALDRQLSKRDQPSEERDRSALSARRSVVETALPDSVSEAELTVSANRPDDEVSSGDFE
ncbi:MAG: winged helix-turn-helix transcriptional regulator [Haloarculaceae archaeon]